MSAAAAAKQTHSFFYDRLRRRFCADEERLRWTFLVSTRGLVDGCDFTLHFKLKCNLALRFKLECDFNFKILETMFGRIEIDLSLLSFISITPK